jgi:hypothetical protein
VWYQSRQCEPRILATDTRRLASSPLQGAVRLPAQPRPGEFDHCRAHASVVPSFPIPCSRSLPPLENGVPPSPAGIVTPFSPAPEGELPAPARRRAVTIQHTVYLTPAVHDQLRELAFAERVRMHAWQGKAARRIWWIRTVSTLDTAAGQR